MWKVVGFLFIFLFFAISFFVIFHIYTMRKYFKAIIDGDFEKVRAFINKNSELVNAKIFGVMQLGFVSVGGYKEILDLLLLMGVDIGSKQGENLTALHVAIGKGRTEIAKLLIFKGAGVNTRSFGMSPLHWATMKGMLGVIEVLLSSGADVNARNQNGWTSLHEAARKGHKEIVELLISRGADINARNSGMTPLNRAAIDGHKEVIELLRKQGGK